jgi:hypothetical protein
LELVTSFTVQAAGSSAKMHLHCQLSRRLPHFHGARK